jgi:photosystem II stability/assembly factor-like uncharacterized protein
VPQPWFGRPPRPRSARPRLEALEDRTLPAAWTPIDPGALLNGQTPGYQPVSGRIAAVAADPTNPADLYVAAAGGGVWKTTDAGTTWTPLTDNQPTLFMGALALAPSNPNVLYAGTGEANNSGDSYYGRGILKSSDGGATWALLGSSLFNRRTVSRIVVHPTDPNTVYVAVSDFGINGLSGNTGIWKSTNGGATWTDTTAAIPGLSATDDFSDLLMDPTNAQVLYAAVGTPSGGPANGVYKTTDGGKTWAAAGNFPLGRGDGNIRIALAPSAPQTLFAAVTDPVTDGLGQMLKSTDGGAHWLPLANVPDYLTASSDGGQGDYDSTLAVNPSNPNVVYAGGSFDAGSFLQSTDGGLTWTDIEKGADGNGVHADHHAIAFDAAGRLLDGDDGGLWRLDNATPGSIHWTDLNGGLSTIQDNSIALSPADPNLLYGATQDNGTDVYVSRQAGVVTDGGDGGVVLVDPSHPSTVYHTFGWGEDAFIERSDDGGQTWAAKVTGINTDDNARFYFPMVLDAARPGRLLMGTDHVYETTDRGEHWTAIGGPGSPGWTTTAGIDSLATAPGNANFIYASAGGHFYASTDHGGHWAQLDPVPVRSPLLRYADILVDPTNPYTVYVVAANFNDVTGGGHVWETTNGGYSWHNITGNLPDLPTWSIALDPNGPGLRDDVLYVGTDSGVYASTGLSGSWSRFGTGLPNVQVVDVELNTSLGILAAGTHGRGVWETDARSPSVAAPPVLSLTESFDTTPVGALPAGWSQWSSVGGPAFDVTPRQSVSAPHSLAVTTPASVLAARAWLNTTAPADVQVSASVFLGSSIPAQVMARGTHLNSAAPTYYAAAVTRGMQVQLLAVVNGATTVLGRVVSKTYLSYQWVRVTLRVVGSAVQAQVYRLDQHQYLTPGGLWQAAPAWALTLTETAVAGPGQVGLGRAASYAGALYFDDLSVSSPGATGWPPPRVVSRS